MSGMNGQHDMAPQPNGVRQQQLLTVQVPDGMGAGQQLGVQCPNGQQFTVIIPEGCTGGSTFQVTLQPPPQQQPQLLTVQVPDGMEAGQQLGVQWNNQQFTVIIPEGCTGGSTFQVQFQPSFG